MQTMQKIEDSRLRFSVLFGIDSSQSERKRKNHLSALPPCKANKENISSYFFKFFAVAVYGMCGKLRVAAWGIFPPFLT